jgi:hypothetical protein
MKQINLNFKTPNWFKWIGWIVAILIILFFKACNPEPKFVTVETPEIKGQFIGQKPNAEIVHDTVYLKGNTVVKVNPLNAELKYENSILMEQFLIVDSINKANLYQKAIAISRFSTKFDDENLELNIEGIVRGEVQEITPSYVIKARKLEVPIKIKQPYFILRAGAEIGNNQNFDGFVYKGNIFINNFSVSIDNQKNYFVGYSIPILTLKK